MVQALGPGPGEGPPGERLLVSLPVSSPVRGRGLRRGGEGCLPRGAAGLLGCGGRVVETKLPQHVFGLRQEEVAAERGGV